ncbi:TetR/AcrR family transcriptional regulator [Shewanella aestuarii]|uniref:TetR/AcrR family transcriptional regulator n=1 Tax=Shewanella aestuarii TaxID=1028752 RepID=A0A6G9QIQ4_9GAMM|nr:TetR/AcrR family transcriptional regulator [Shewanella aestuarii]QIR13761.1 TetR/AcrR family transcriptional regulator [Shewanella aestuarii]
MKNLKVAPTEKKAALLDSALSLFVKQGFHATSTASIAKAAGVATGTLFHHFPSKDAILNELFINIKQSFADSIIQTSQLTGNIEQDANTLWQSAIDWAIANPLKQTFFLQFSFSVEINPSIRQQAMNEILGFIVELIEQGLKQNVIADFPVPLLLENCHGQYLAAIRFFTDNPQLGQDSTYRQASFQLFWRAMKK